MKNPPVIALAASAITLRPLFFTPPECWAEEEVQPVVPHTVDKEALFRNIIREYGKSLYHFILRRLNHADDAAEIAQQTLVKAACKFTSFRGEAEFSTWIFGIAANLSRNHVSRAPQRRNRFEPDVVLDNWEPPEPQPSENLSQRQGLELVSQAISRMPPEMAQAPNLVAVEEMSYNKEIGLRLGLAEITVKTHLTAIFRQLGVVNRTQAVIALRRLGIDYGSTDKNASQGAGA